jgi:hypothetical protein
VYQVEIVGSDVVGFAMVESDLKKQDYLAGIGCSMLVDYVRMLAWNLKVRIVTFDVEGMGVVRRESQLEVFAERASLDSANCDVEDVSEAYWIGSSFPVVGMTMGIGDVVRGSVEFGGFAETDIDWHSLMRACVDMVTGRSRIWQESVNRSAAGLEWAVEEEVESNSCFLDMLLVMHKGHRLVNHSPVTGVCPVRLAGDILESPAAVVQLV